MATTRKRPGSYRETHRCKDSGLTDEPADERSSDALQYVLDNADPDADWREIWDVYTSDRDAREVWGDD
jgi:hypothetical protein